jgi:predicted nucleic acid-binding protein
LSLILDASMAIAWVFDDEGPQPLNILIRVRADGAVVPSHWRLEIASALRSAVTRRRYTERFVSECLADLGNLPIVVDGETDSRAWGRTRKLSNEYDLTVYDAAYLELALRRKLPLASCDQALIAAAKRARLEVLAG